jgi:type IV secretory pathway VirD2 relaxase
MIIDFHAHIYPDKIAAKAVVNIGEFYKLPMEGDGIVQGLLDSGRKGKGVTEHQRFIKEYLPQENKSRVKEKPELFNTETIGKDYLDEYTQAITGRHFKFIISPEIPRVDIPTLVKTLVKRMEKITGCSFHWMAAVHTDTDHSHAHLLLNGTDRNGKTVDFTNLFIRAEGV